MFGIDLFGDYITDMYASIAELFAWAFGELFKLGQADYSAQWFIDTYQVSFGLAVLVWSLLLALNILALSQRTLDPGQFAHNLTTRTVAFFYGAALGPLLGRELGRITSQLAQNFLAFGVTGSLDEVSDNMFDEPAESGALAEIVARMQGVADGGVMGGRFVAFLIGIVLVLTMLGIAMLVAVVSMLQYIIGAFFPLVWVFITSSKHRGLAKKFLTVAFALYLILPAVALIVAIILRAFGSFDPAIYETNPAENLMFALSLMVGMFMAIAIPLATLAAVAKAGLGAASAGHSMVTAGATGGGAIGTGGAAKAATSNKAIGTAGTAAGVGATVATAGGAAPAAAAGGAAKVGTAATGAATGAANAGRGAAVAGASGGNATTQGARAGAGAGDAGARAAKSAATGERLRAGTSLAQIAEEQAQRSKIASSQNTQTGVMGAHLVDGNDAEGSDR